MLAVSDAEVRRAAATMVVGGPVTATPLVSAAPPARHVRSGGAGPDMGAEAGFRRMGRDYGRAWTRSGPGRGPARSGNARPPSPFSMFFRGNREGTRMAQDRNRAEESGRRRRDPGHKPGVLERRVLRRAAARRAADGGTGGRPGGAVSEPHGGGVAGRLGSVRRRAVLRAAAALAATRPDRPKAQEGGRLAVEDAWARPATDGDGGAAVFLRLRNPGPEPAWLAAAATPAAARIEVQETVMEFGVPHPRPHAGPVVVPPGGVVSFEPGGLRLALVRPVADLGRFPLTLRFADGGTRTIVVPVRAIGAGQTIGEQDGHVPH